MAGKGISPFDKAKYTALLEGLEVVEINYLNTRNIDINNRIDAEYFKKEYIILEKTLIDKNSIKLQDISNKIINFGAYSLCSEIEYLEQGVPYLFVGDIKENIIDLSNVKYIDENLSKNLLSKSLVKDNQLLLTIAGTIGNCAVASNLPNFTNSNQAIANIYLKENIYPYYVSTFLNSKYGKLQTKRNIISNVQPNLLLNQVKQILIFLPNLELQQKIELLVKSAHEKLEQSQNLYKQAEQILLNELGLNNYKPSTENIAIKSLKDSFINSGRLDAEYYQPKYEELEEYIKNYKYKKLGNIANIQKSIEPGSQSYQSEGIPFIRVSNISKFGLNEPEIFLDKEIFTNTLRIKKDTILLTKDGTVGIAYKSNQDLESITSGAILHLNIKEEKKQEILADYLTLVLNSIVVKMQAEKDAGGSIIQHWKSSEIQEVIIPILDINTQTQIAQKIQQSFILKAQSQKLLEVAKKAVEMAIEENEEIAMNYIQEIINIYF